MKQIKLTKGYYALVDDEDFKKFSKYKWCALKSKIYVYAVRRITLEKWKSKLIMLHREIVGLKHDSPLLVDHRNHNTLDCQKENLRVCTSSQNRQNQVKHKGHSKYKGVYFNKHAKGWFSQIKANGKLIYLGRYKSEDMAAKVYDEAARKFHGDFAYLNFGGKN